MPDPRPEINQPGRFPQGLAEPDSDEKTRARQAESERQAEAEFEARREAWGPQWPAWLSMTDIEPEPEATL